MPTSNNKNKQQQLNNQLRQTNATLSCRYFNATASRVAMHESKAALSVWNCCGSIGGGGGGGRQHRSKMDDTNDMQENYNCLMSLPGQMR